ncbi:MAG: potassium-transporting ATPase subunit KdpA [Thermoplasmata archaeon]|nr:potassium-transporting ATPase subunit KdpA [Thermoplasmata archaeon]
MVDFGAIVEVAVVLAIILAVAAPFGAYLGRVYTNRPAFGDRFLLPLEGRIYRLLGVSARESMGYREYASSLLFVSALTAVWMFLMMWFQASLFPQPAGFTPMSWDTIVHTTASFLTATDFTHLAPEVNMTVWGNLLALEVPMFLAPAAALSVAAAMARGFIRKDGTIGNFYVDMVRSLTRVLLPIALVGGAVLALLSVPDAFPPLLWAGPHAANPVFNGPVAGMQSIVYLGSNGGGWTSANVTSSLANPSIWTQTFGMGLFLLLPFSFPFAFASIVRRPGEAWPYLGTVLIVFVVGLALFLAFEGPPGLGLSGYRFGVVPDSSFQFASVYSNTGSNNLNIAFLAPVPQMALLFGMFTQNTPGSDGVGFGTLLIFALLAIFVGGLMVGRTPEYLGKRITPTTVKWTALVLLYHPVAVLVPTAAAYLGGFVPSTGLFTPVPFCSSGTCLNAHAFSSVLYEFTSESANNGSGMSSFNDVTLFFNLAGAGVILVGRFLPMIAMLKIGSEFARTTALPPGPGTLETRSLTFTLYLTLLLIVVSALLFLPVIALGPLSQVGG